MTGLVTVAPDELPSGRRLCEIRLAHAARSNALCPALLDALADALAGAGRMEARFILLTAEGRNFSTGGDVARFRDAVAEGRALAYADTVVGRLNEIILALLGAPALVVAAAGGAITGGSTGLVLAADMVVLGEDAFIQPWYREVGFAPDGGWTALLPEAIGAHRALSIQMRNARIEAPEALGLGLADLVAPDDPRTAALAAIAEMDAAEPDALIAAKRLVWDEARRTCVAAWLAAERQAFCARIGLPETARGMDRFLSRRRKRHA